MCRARGTSGPDKRVRWRAAVVRAPLNTSGEVIAVNLQARKPSE